MTDSSNAPREGSLEAPTRHPIDWRNDTFYDEDALNTELERVFDICHGCRRCVNLCNSFPTLFDLVDESSTMEVDGVDKADYVKVVDECFMCDLCFLTKCPYVPPHEWNVDFPHLMLRAKAVKYRKGETKARDRLITSTDAVGKLASIPIVANVVNAANKHPPLREQMERVLEVHKDAPLPEYNAATLRKRVAGDGQSPATPRSAPVSAGRTRGQVALFATCYCNYNEPEVGEDLIKVFEHNGIATVLTAKEQCCGMPKLELGNLLAVERAKQANIPELLRLIDAGYDIVAAVPSCVLMFRQELPLMFPEDADVAKVSQHIFDPFEYLFARHRAGALNTDFKQTLGKVAYHAACHQRVQNVGPKTRDVLALVPDTQVTMIERCSGHDGTYAVKKESREASLKIVRPIVRQVRDAEVDHYGSDCPMAGRHIEASLNDGQRAEHPLTLLRRAYAI